ncbi:hypothetical protein T459_19159 [Capsicum annuum]|uniref:Ubiquitin-like protease family profile domain-containing protein n=1 Tax=Capsicum annuum TaxID=4072 RepID=A0A2G2Z0U2_CAPAN|nr:hypothetical protein T459_19159 [Capsicum annuum]
MRDLKNFMETRNVEVQNNIDAVKLAEIYILGRVLLGGRLTKVIYANLIMILEDADLCKEYGYGELSFDETISSLKSSLKPTKTTVRSSYQLIGFPFVFMLKADGDILSDKQLDNFQGEPSRDPMVDDQYDDPHRPTKNERSEKKWRAEEGKNTEGHSDKKEEVAEERVTSLGPLNMEEMRQAKNQEKTAEAEVLLPFPLVEEFSKSSPYSELQDFGSTKVDEDNIDETNNYGDVDSIINNVISSVFAVSSSLPTSPDVKNTQAEISELGGINNDTTDVISNVDATMKFHNEQESTRVSPMKSKVSPLKRKGSPMKKRIYIRKKKGSKAAISDVACELNSMASSMKTEAKDATPRKSHLDTIFYYMKKKAKYEPNIVVKFTTTDFVFRNKIDALYHDFMENKKDFSAIPVKHEVDEYIRGFYCDANMSWNKVDYVLFPVYVPREKSELGHWILGVFDFTDWCIYVYDSNRTRLGDKVVQKVMLHYKILTPYFLKKVNFYLKKGIVKSENDTLPMKMVDELPQKTQCDCRAFICAFAEYVIHGRDIPKEIDIGHVHMRYGALLWDYGKRKLEAALHSLSVKENQQSFFCKLKEVTKHKPAEDIKKWNHALSSMDLQVSALFASLIEKLLLKARTFSTTSCGSCNQNKRIKIYNNKELIMTIKPIIHQIELHKNKSYTDSVMQGYLDVCLLPSRTSLSGGFVIRSFMLSGIIHDVVLPTGRISPRRRICHPRNELSKSNSQYYVEKIEPCSGTVANSILMLPTYEQENQLQIN